MPKAERITREKLPITIMKAGQITFHRLKELFSEFFSFLGSALEENIGQEQALQLIAYGILKT